jgi:hypothetical protein
LLVVIIIIIMLPNQAIASTPSTPFQLLVVDGLGGCPMGLSLARKTGDVPVV